MYNVRQEGNNVTLDVLNALLIMPNVVEKALFQCGKNTRKKVLARVSKGKATNGQELVTKSPKKTGNYSSNYAQRRANFGKQTKVVDLNFSGELVADYGIIERSSNRLVIGFETEENANLAEWQEKYFEKDVFDVEQGIIDVEIEIMNDTVTNELFK